MKKSILLSLIFVFGVQSIAPSDQTNNSFWKIAGFVAGCAVLYRLLVHTSSSQAQLVGTGWDHKVITCPVSSRLNSLQIQSSEPASWKKDLSSRDDEGRQVRFAEAHVSKYVPGAFIPKYNPYLSRYYDGESIMQVPVLMQGSSSTSQYFRDPFWVNIFTRVESTNCGYHALKNAICGLNYYAGKMDKSRKDFVDPEYYKLITKPLIQSIQARNARLKKGNSLGTMISGDDIDYLIQKCLPSRRSSITVVDSFEIFEDASKMSQESLMVLQNIARKDFYVHAFIVNTDALKPAAMHRGFHWAVYMLIKQADKVQVVCMDSLQVIDLEIARKIRSFASLTQKDVDLKLEHMHKSQIGLHALEQQAVQECDDKYFLKGYAAISCSLGVIDFESLPLRDFLQGKTGEELEKIKKAFEDGFSTHIASLRKTRFVKIDSIVDKQLTQMRKAEIIQQLPEKNYIFTIWQSSKTNQWHVEYACDDNCELYIAKKQKQYGVKLDQDRSLRLYDVV